MFQSFKCSKMLGNTPTHTHKYSSNEQRTDERLLVVALIFTNYAKETTGNKYSFNLKKKIIKKMYNNI